MPPIRSECQPKFWHKLNVAGLLENARSANYARRTGDCGLENCWRSAAASRVGKIVEMHRDAG